MRKQTHKPRRLLSIVLCLALILSYLPAMSIIAASAAPSGTGSSVYNGAGDKVADPETVNDWKDFFGSGKLDTSYVGGVWTDKSVFTSVEDYIDATAEEEDADFGLQMLDENNFLVALSAIASTKSVEGYSALPSDTILVLDLSASMIDNQAVDAMIQAANDAIKELQELNAYNRVGVVAYSGNTENDYSNTNTAEVILPLGRYTAGADSKYLVDTWTTGSGRNSTDHIGVKVASGVTGTKAAGVTAAFSTNNAKDADGGTYIQNGLYQAWKMFEEVTDTTITDDGLQAGVNRMPILVLLSDGAPTTATTSYTNVGRSDSGDGTSNYATNGIAFLTQLTASWVKSKMEQKYGEDALFYTLGLNVGNNDAAKNVLDPSNNNGTDSYWTTFKGLSGNQSMTVTVRGSGNNAETCRVSYSSPVSAAWEDEYVTEYFPASNADGLIDAFDSIIEKIIIQSMYYPTLVNSGDINQDGFLVFEDYIGKNMEVKAIKGIQLGTTLYTGETLAYLMASGGMGTEDEPSDIGNELVWSVQKRLGIDNVTTARKLLEQAYAHGQLAWYGPGNFSNYIGWYADASGKYVGFWDGVSTDPKDVPAEYAAEAVYAIKSYGYYGAAGEDHRAADTMYATIQVRTTLKDSAEGKTDASEVGDIQVIGRLPASLIPLVEYDIQLNGTDPMNPSSMTVSGATAPSRLIYEVGLSSKIDLLDIEATAPDPDALQTENGNYVFYTNQWHSIDNDYSYATNKNTTSYFEPSEENERYYYSVNTPIYTDENGTLYKGTEAPAYSANDLYYHRYLYYTKSGNTVTANWLYEQISEYVLNDSSDLQRQSDGSWIVKKGTVHHYFGDYVADKESNPTDTLGVSDMPFVHDPEAGIAGSKGAYHIDSYLGNNGKLTIDPYEGIAISKTASTAITDRDQEYTFTITASDNSFDATCTLITENALGVRTTGEVTFANGMATVKLKHGETAYVLGEDMIGKTFTVAESIDNGAGYYVSSISVDGALVDNASIPVASGVINQVSFYNEKTSEGNLFITKEVHHSQSGQTVPADMLETPFTITVDFGEGLAGETYNVAHSGDDTLTSVTVENDGTNEFTIKHGETIEIFGLPQGTNVTVTEALDDNSNFKVSYRSRSHSGEAADDDGTVTIPANANSTVVVTNTYTPKTTGINLDISGSKNFVLENVALSADSTFTFLVQQYDGLDSTGKAIWTTIATDSVTYATDTSGEKTFSFENVLSNVTYTHAGTYAYQVIEEIPTGDGRIEGVTYDRTTHTIVVTVEDKGGQLTVTNVVSGNVSNSDNGWTVSTAFTNTYHTAPVSIDVIKTVENPSNSPLATKDGFTFVLYNATVNGETWTVGDTKDTQISDAAGEARFYWTENDAGTHYYILKEEGTDGNGWTYDKTEYHITVVVSVDDTGNVTAETSVEQIGSEAKEVEGTTVTFTNTYDPGNAELSLDAAVKKELMGRDLNAGEFTFSVYADLDPNVTSSEDHTDGRLKLTGTNDADGNVTFDGTLTFDKVGTYYFDIVEMLPDEDQRVPGITYDKTIYDLVVEVTDDGNGKLVADYYFEDAIGDTVTFTNHYTAAPVEVTLHATKILEGGIRTLQPGMFEFELRDKNSSIDLPLLQTVSNTVPDEDGYNVFFDALTFDTAGTYTYIIQEKLPEGVGRGESDPKKLNGTTYDTGVRTIFIKVTDNGNGQLEAEVTYPTDGAKFTNSYTVDPSAPISFGGTKELVGDLLSNHIFKAELYAAHYDTATHSIVQGDRIDTVDIGSNGRFSFKNVTYHAPGVHRYIVKEQVGTEDYMDYDLSTYYIEVVVTDDMEGGLDTTTTITRVDEDGLSSVVDSIAFQNVLNPKPLPVEIGGKKDYNTTLPAGKFSFVMYQGMKNSEGSIYPVGDVILETSNAADGSFTFRDDMYLTFTEAGTHYFVIQEKLPEDVTDQTNHIIYDTKSYGVTVEVAEVYVDGRNTLTATVTVDGDGKLVFKNTYDPSTASVIIRGTKVLDGRDLEAGEFQFQLIGADGKVIETVKNNADGSFTFSAIPYDLSDAGKTYTYTVKEVKGSKGGITYDDTVYRVIVEVKDDGKGELTATASYPDGDKFTNTYKAGSTNATIVGTKVLTGRDLAVNEFEFQLIDADGKVIETVKNAADGSFTFSEITYDKEGIYTYTVKEVKGSLEDIIYDDTSYTVTVTVTDKGNGTMTASVSHGKEQLKFTNRYELDVPDATTMDIGGTKILKDANGKVVTLGDKKFEFALYFTDSTFTVAENAIPYAIVKNGADGKFEFTDLPIDSEGTLYFVVKELEGSYDDIITDSTVYQGVVTVSNVDGTLVPTLKVYVEGEEVSDIAFTNQYEPESTTPPPTNGSNTLWLWLALMVISGGSIVTLFTKKVRYVPKHLLK